MIPPASILLALSLGPVSTANAAATAPLMHAPTLDQPAPVQPPVVDPPPPGPAPHPKPPVCPPEGECPGCGLG